MDLTTQCLLKHGFEPAEIVELVGALRRLPLDPELESAEKRSQILLHRYAKSLEQVRAELVAMLDSCEKASNL